MAGILRHALEVQGPPPLCASHKNTFLFRALSYESSQHSTSEIMMKHLAALMMMGSFLAGNHLLAGDWVTYEGKSGPGKGKHIVFVSGDEEYRSEEGLPMLAQILAVRHGFKTTVLFALDPADGTIDPNNQTNIVGLKALETADMMVILTRFREPPTDQMKYIVDYV